MTETPSTEVEATTNEPPLVSWLSNMQGEIQRALPRHMSAERVARVTLTQVRKIPELASCTPASFFGALLTAAALGLEPGVNGECYLLPYKDRRSGVTQCELVIGYQGLVKLFWQHPLARRLSADIVYERDHFVLDKGLHPRLEHTPATGDRGQIIGYYAIAELATGGANFDYFTVDQIHTLRGTSQSRVTDPEHWMERKTALKQVLKLMPKSTELVHALKVDESIGSMDVPASLVQGAGLPDTTHVDDLDATDDAQH